MSVSKSPLRNQLLDINRREDRADARKTATVIGVLCAFAALAFVFGITTMVWPQ